MQDLKTNYTFALPWALADIAIFSMGNNIAFTKVHIG